MHMFCRSVLLLTLLVGATFGQTRPATQPIIKTATPNGYVRIEAAGRAFVCLPEDRAWITDAATRAAKVQGPSTRPADMIGKLKTRRDQIVAGMCADLTDVKPSQVEAFLDGKLLPPLQDASKVHARMVYLVTPAEHIKKALRDGWRDSRVRWNDISGSMDIDASVAMDANPSESTVMAIFTPSDTAEQRTALLSKYIVNTEQQVQQQLTARATTLALTLTADFVAKSQLKDLPQKEDQVWLVTGLSNVLAARYVSMIHGSPVDQFVEAMIIGPQQTPVSAAALDLLNPTPLSSIRDEFVPAQVDARRRKAIASVYVWLRDAGNDKLLPTLQAVKTANPADGATLAKVMQDASGVDIATLLKRR
jgi:hypothetical protein